MKILFKGCSKCRGDMHLNRDVYGAYAQCIQCGRITDLERPVNQFELKR